MYKKTLKAVSYTHLDVYKRQDICWIEEGQSISKKSWEILDPTIRKPGAQIWISMNRELENDPIWVALARNPHEDVYIQKVNYTDNL